MLAQLSLACLIANPIQTQDPTMPDQITEAFGKVVSVASDLKQQLPSVSFHIGACLLGGSLRQGGSFTQMIIVQKAGNHAVVSGAYGNDYEVEVSVKNDKGKNVVTSKEEDGIDFNAAKPGRYFITARNKGAHTFVALAVLRESGGANHPISSMNIAVANIAEGIKSSFSDGYSAPTNELMVLGVIMAPNATHAWDRGFNYPRWMMIGATETDARSLNLSITDKRTKKVFNSFKDKNYTFGEFDRVIPTATITMKNTGSKKMFSVQALVR